MNDPKPDEPSPPEQDGDGAADNSGGIAANQVNPDLPLVDPAAD